MGIPIKAFTTSSNIGILNVLRSKVTIGLAFDSSKSPVPTQSDFEAIWDTGATASAISKSVVQRVGLQPTGIARIHTAGGIHDCNTFFISIMLPNKVGFAAVRVSECELTGADVLIGMDIIANGDFVITNYEGKTVFSYRTPSVNKIDFVEEIKRYNASQMKAGRNDPCPCGSGKKYKRCHGAK